MHLKNKISLVYRSRRSMTPRKVWNYALVWLSERLSYLLKHPIVWGFPLWTIIEPANACNLNCPGCYTGGGLRKDKSDILDFEIFKKVVDGIPKSSMGILLYFRGEPMLNKRIVDMIKYAKSKGFIVRTGTNAQLIDTPELAYELVKSGLDWIRIPIDGATEESYSKYRVGGTLEKAKNAIRLLSEAKKELNSPTPTILAQFIVFKHTEDEIEEGRKIAYECGADQFYLKTPMVFSAEQGKELLPKNKKFWRYNETPDGLELKSINQNRCRRLWTYYNINVDGVVVPCCFDANKDYAMGNAFEESVREIWKKKEYMEFRKAVIQNRKSIS
ncbi:MAG: radical SAM/SPASM domain-containing protein, partial [bacterium]